MNLDVLDLFSAAAGGWSLGMHRAGFRTVAACEFVDWRRALYSQNNPGVLIYDDVRTLTADRIVSDLGYLPGIVVGSPPCQDISPANTKGKGVAGERSGLYFEAVRIIGEVRPRWFALENSANLRTRGADRIIDALAAIGYTCWPFVVSAGDIGANHERKRSWIVGFNLSHADDQGKFRRAEYAEMGIVRTLVRTAGDTAQDGLRQGRSWGYPVATEGLSFEACGDAPNTSKEGRREGASRVGCMEASTGAASGGAYAPSDARIGDGEAGCEPSQMGRSTSLGGPPTEPWANWNGGLAHHLRMDDGLSAWVAQSRIAVGGPRGTSAASLIVEAFGDAVVPQIPEAIGRAILRTEQALAAVYGRRAA